MTYRPLYPPEGAPCLGFACSECGRVTKTERGMRMHLVRVHDIKPQGELFDVHVENGYDQSGAAKAEDRASEGVPDARPLFSSK